MAANNMVTPAVNPDIEDDLFQKEVQQVKDWWRDSRWRQTKRPFTAEQIVSKRGHLKIEYPSNAQAKKLWNIMENRFQVSHTKVFSRYGRVSILPRQPLITRNRTKMLATLTAAWSLQWSPRWPSTSTRSTSPAGNHRQPLPRRTSPVPIWLITLM